MSAVGIVEEHRARVLADAVKLLAAIKPIIEDEAASVMFSNCLWDGQEPIRESLDLETMALLEKYERLVADIEHVLMQAEMLS